MPWKRGPLLPDCANTKSGASLKYSVRGPCLTAKPSTVPLMRSSRRRKRWPLRLKTTSSDTILHSSGPMFLPPTCFRAGRKSSQETAGTLAFSGPVLRGSELAGDVAMIAVDSASRMIWRVMAVLPGCGALELAPLSTHLIAETGCHASAHQYRFVPLDAVLCRDRTT